MTTQQKRWMKEVRHKKHLIAYLLCAIFLVNLSLTDFEVDGVSVILPTEIETPDIDDLAITLETNQSTIGNSGGVLANLTLANNGINPVSNIQVDFEYDGEYTEFSSKYPEHQEVTLINSGFSSSLFIELILNETTVSDLNTSAAADVLLIFDASGSMGDEIDDVKSEFLAITSRLAEKIPLLRMGVMIYGCDIYSVYPQEHPSNYIEFTSDFNAINTFISNIVVTGGYEPWGDALAFANTWGWRENTPKLIIMVGDEDCDPGHLVGVGHEGEDYYNGTQLVNAVTNLKEKEIEINTVITGISGIVVNQFNWIANYTNGECVDLEEMQSLPDPIDLPELIESWTLELTREYFVNLSASISWTENTPGGDEYYETTESLYIVVDLASPYIVVSSLISQVDYVKYRLFINVKPEDISGIASTIIYWTHDDLDEPLEPTWHFELLTNPIHGIYSKRIDDLYEGEKISYYIVVIDNVGNLGKTDIFNETITFTTKGFGVTIDLSFQEDNSSIIVPFDMGLETEGFLIVESIGNLEITLEDEMNFTIEHYNTGSFFDVYEITKLSTETTVKIKISGNASSFAKLYWNSPEVINNYDMDNEVFSLTNTPGYNNHLFDAYLGVNGTLSVLIISPELIPYFHVFDYDWNYIDTVTPAHPVNLTKGMYRILVERYHREGSFGFHFGEEEISYTDPYYTVVYSGYTWLITSFTIGIVAIISAYLTRKRFKKREVS
ncbi:MAG: VWA domain-containing protein [Asgard group archaeon]|nr:VWA domain-containing protein [Asgard group archaeon]